jgi:hypothetical protein
VLILSRENKISVPASNQNLVRGAGNGGRDGKGAVERPLRRSRRTSGGQPGRSRAGARAEDNRSNVWEPTLLSGGAPGQRWCGELGHPSGAPPLWHWTGASVVQLVGLGNDSRQWAAAGGPVGGGGTRCGSAAVQACCMKVGRAPGGWLKLKLGHPLAWDKVS